jgi:diguanylate cyclase (GGDEF)-like protein
VKEAMRAARRKVEGRKPYLTHALLLLLAVILAAAALFTASSIVRQQSLLRNISRFQAGWVVGQAATEVARLQAAVGALALQNGSEQQDAVHLWLDIIANRLPLLEGGKVGAFVSQLPEHRQILDNFRAAVREADDVVDKLDDRAVQQRLLNRLASLSPQLGRLASAAHVEGSNRSTQDVQDVTDLFWSLSCILLGLTLCSAVLIGLTYRSNRQLREANSSAHRFASDLQRSNVELEQAHAELERSMRNAEHQNAALIKRETDLQLQSIRFQAALNNMPQGLCMVDAGQRLIVCNERFAALFRLTPFDAQPGMLIRNVFARAGERCLAFPGLADDVYQRQKEMADHMKSGSALVEQPGSVAISIVHQRMEDGGWVATYEDITEQRTAAARIHFMAHYDHLTGLSNRASFQSMLDEALHVAGEPDRSVAVLYLDLDGFKAVNDTLGHPAGDELLRSVGTRLRSEAHQTDVVARLGGDEFAIIQLDAEQPASSGSLAERLIAALQVPFDLSGRKVEIGVSIGVALPHGNTTTADELQRNADAALYRAKAAGRGTWRLYDCSMDREVQHRRRLEADLRLALPEGQLALHYQPLIESRTGALTGFEALLRWHHPKLGMISPAVFIPIAEETGLIHLLGHWALTQACTDAAGWPNLAKVAVNLSAVQFVKRNLVQDVEEALARSGLAANRLELEITESILLQDTEATMAVLHRLRGLGVRVSMDDFGTGYSSLSYLRRFPFDKIKLDQSFIRSLATEKGSLAIIRAVVGLGREMGMAVLAEGVETVQQLDILRNEGCDELQGYLFSRPVPIDKVNALFSVYGISASEPAVQHSMVTEDADEGRSAA